MGCDEFRDDTLIVGNAVVDGYTLAADGTFAFGLNTIVGRVADEVRTKHTFDCEATLPEVSRAVTFIVIEVELVAGTVH
jgi:hypothetical protein